jgi:NitT/TauT family transport system substrate-binding protein
MRILHLATALAVSLGIAVAPAAAQTKVRQTGCLVMDMAVPFIAKTKGFFAQNGLDWEYSGADCGRVARAALISGDAQFTDMGMDDIARLKAEGKELLGIYSMVNSMTMDLVVRNDSMAKANLTTSMPLTDKIKGLKGMTLGITRPGSAGHVFAGYLLKKGGLDPEKDVTFVQIGQAAALVTAVKTQRIDGFLIGAPAPFLVERDKAGTILIRNSAGEGPPEFKDFAFETIAVQKAWAEKNPKLVEAYTKSLRQAYAWMVANKADAVKALQTYFPDTDEATLTISFNALIPALIPDGRLTETAIKNHMEVMKALGALDKIPDTAEGVLWTNKYNS